MYSTLCFGNSSATLSCHRTLHTCETFLSYEHPLKTVEREFADITTPLYTGVAVRRAFSAPLGAILRLRHVGSNRSTRVLAYKRVSRDWKTTVDYDDGRDSCALESSPPLGKRHHLLTPLVFLSFFFFIDSLYGWRFPLPYCDQKMANVAGVTANHESGSGKNTIRLVKHTAM